MKKTPDSFGGRKSSEMPSRPSWACDGREGSPLPASPNEEKDVCFYFIRIAVSIPALYVRLLCKEFRVESRSRLECHGLRSKDKPSMLRMKAFPAMCRVSESLAPNVHIRFASATTERER
jgi:hypothetical protein